MRDWLYGFLLCMAFIGAAGVADMSCYAHTPDGPTCAQAPNTPGCLGPLQDERAPDAGR
jgi:hypothetical protein